MIPASPAGKETLPESRTPEQGGSTLPVEAETASGAAAKQDTPAVAVGDAPAKPSGHGRNGANAYTAAEKIEVPHPTLWPGDPCPTCETGTVYETNRPGVVVRLVGASPRGTTIYYLQKLRCNPCGAVFTAELPPDAGGTKRDATVGSMIALLRWDGHAVEPQRDAARGAGHSLARLQSRFRTQRKIWQLHIIVNSP